MYIDICKVMNGEIKFVGAETANQDPSKNNCGTCTPDAFVRDDVMKVNPFSTQELLDILDAQGQVPT